MHQPSKPLLIGVVIGCGVGLLFFAFSFLTTFGICGDTRFAEMLFPYSVAADPTLDDRVLVAFVLACLQYPIYGLGLGYVWQRNRPLLKFLLIGLLVIHGVGAGIAKDRVSDMWQQRFQNVR